MIANEAKRAEQTEVLVCKPTVPCLVNFILGTFYFI